MSVHRYHTSVGHPHPLGATVTPEGVNFSLFSQNATGVELLLFERPDDPEPVQVISLDPTAHKSQHVWHVFVRGLPPGAGYAYRVDGPQAPSEGQRFNPRKVLIDPYAVANTDALWDYSAACGPADNLASSMRSIVVDLGDYDWEGDRPLDRPMAESIIYEMHVGGFTRHSSSRCKHPGTFAAVAEKVSYLKELGVTAVELMPVAQFDRVQIVRTNPETGEPLHQYWGYMPLSFFAPHPGYCISPDLGTQIREFRDMVKVLHKHGIEVILDVVFNHTGEGDHTGPTVNLRGIDNSIYYHLVDADRARYVDWAGAGNTLRCSHPMVQKLVVECLRFWARELHVDGFRFDEATVLARGENGDSEPMSPLVWAIDLSEDLADAKLIAEAWDAAGAYKVPDFPGYRWAVWNGSYRDTIRRFVRGDGGVIGAVACRIAGSADLFEERGHLPVNGVNYVTSHDGFTLWDLVSYNEKHNAANGEASGTDDNLSWNCGVEGPTPLPEINALRRRQIKNFAAILLLSQGVPMILSGDEVCRTQQGNNNPYCQDNEVSWLDWDLIERNQEMFRFFREMIAFRKRHPILRRRSFLTGRLGGRGLPDLAWYGCRLRPPDWRAPDTHALAFLLTGRREDPDLYVMMNMYWEELEFEVPALPGRHWTLAIDTAGAPSEDIFPHREEPAVPPMEGAGQPTRFSPSAPAVYTRRKVAARSLQVLITRT